MPLSKAPLPKIESKLKAFLSPRVEFALLYGSILTKHFKDDSDIDLAVYSSQTLEPPHLLALCDEINVLFEYRYDFDVALLNQADPIIAMQVLATGKPIVVNDEASFVAYKVKMISQYLDFKMSRKTIEDRIATSSIYD